MYCKTARPCSSFFSARGRREISGFLRRGKAAGAYILKVYRMIRESGGGLKDIRECIVIDWICLVWYTYLFAPILYFLNGYIRAAALMTMISKPIYNI